MVISFRYVDSRSVRAVSAGTGSTAMVAGSLTSATSERRKAIIAHTDSTRPLRIHTLIWVREFADIPYHHRDCHCPGHYLHRIRFMRSLFSRAVFAARRSALHRVLGWPSVRR